MKVLNKQEMLTALTNSKNVLIRGRAKEALGGNEVESGKFFRAVLDGDYLKAMEYADLDNQKVLIEAYTEKFGFETTSIDFIENPVLKQVAELALNEGWEVLMDKKSKKYLHFWDGEKLGYCQVDYFPDRVRFSFCNKPSKQGTGFGLQAPYEGVLEPTIENLKECFTPPAWANPAQRQNALKNVYKSLEEYAKTYGGKLSDKYLITK